MDVPPAVIFNQHLNADPVANLAAFDATQPGILR